MIIELLLLEQNGSPDAPTDLDLANTPHAEAKRTVSMTRQTCQEGHPFAHPFMQRHLEYHAGTRE